MQDRPLHARIRADLEERIRSGAWPPGTVLPTEVQLSADWGVSRATVQRAVRDLAGEGLVVRRRRVGTTVAGAASEQNLLRLANVLGDSVELHGDHRLLDSGVIPARDAEFTVPGIEGDDPLIRLRRLKENDRGEAIGIELAFVPFSVAPHLLDEDLIQLTTMAYFRRIGVPLSRSRLYLEPAIASTVEADLLGREVGEPLHRLRRETYLVSGRIAELLIEFLVPDSLRLYVEQTIPPPRETQ